MYCKLITLRTTLNANFPSSNSSTHDTPFQWRQVMELFSQDVMKYSRNRHASLVARTAAPSANPYHPCMLYSYICTRPCHPPPPHGMGPTYWPHMRSSPSPPYGVVGVWHCPPPPPVVWWGCGMVCWVCMVCMVGLVWHVWKVWYVW